MTREEAIECNKNLRMYMKLSDKNQPCKFLEENYIALDMAIKALEQEPVLDKIRAEITEYAMPDFEYHGCGGSQKIVELEDVLEIIDKYTKEGDT